MGEQLPPLLQRRGFRVIGVDDGPSVRGSGEPVLVVAPVLRGDGQFDGLLTTRVTPDGFDATEGLCRMLEGSKFLPQLHYLMIDGITLGGFNVVDLPELARRTGLKVLAVTRRRPDLDAVLRAIEGLPEPDRRREQLLRGGAFHDVAGLSCQLHGLGPRESELLLEVTCRVGAYPEPLRVAHLIAGGVVLGESGRRA